MLTFPSNVRLYLANAPADMRKGFDGLSTLVESELGMSPLRGDLFIFSIGERRRFASCSGIVTGTAC
jgi:transposase